MKGLVMRYAAPVLFDLVTGQVQHVASNGCLHIDQCIMTNSYNSLPCVGVWPTWLTSQTSEAERGADPGPALAAGGTARCATKAFYQGGRSWK